MANTYTQIYIQVVFAVEGRQNLIRPEHKEELQLGGHWRCPFYKHAAPDGAGGHWW